MRDSKVAKRAIGFAGLLTAMLIAAGLAIPQIAGATPNPPGNNGTVKIDNTPFDDVPNNEPHVGCIFQVDFYGYDAGDLNADVTFRAKKPTLRRGDDQVLLTDTVFIGEDDNSGGGSTSGLDASRTYALDLTGITPQDNQGVHVKLTIHADGSRGADTKHKVFWVTGCGSSSTTTTTTTPTGGGGGGGGTTTTTGGGGGGGLGAATTPSGESLPRTGSNSLPILVTGLLLVAVGAGAVLATRRLRTR
jgi:hypothetical protein